VLCVCDGWLYIDHRNHTAESLQTTNNCSAVSKYSLELPPIWIPPLIEFFLARCIIVLLHIGNNRKVLFVPGC